MPKAYTFEQDIKQLHSYVDMLGKEFIPDNIQRAQRRINEIAERIAENKIRSYVPIEVKQYFKTDDQD